MGANTFVIFGKGKDAEDAFTKVVEQAFFDHGHAGYTGTIAEKDSFVDIPIPEDFLPKAEKRTRALDWANNLINEEDKRIDDKWGPAGGSFVEEENGEKTYIFFGWASS
jgi:hypothetical protein